jgi:zinc/manganese transport system substrate-binding protein
MRNRFVEPIGAALVLLSLSGAPQAADKAKAVASFSIIGDMVKQVGGDRVEVTTLVGADEDSHVFSPTPAHARMLAGADIFFVNGLGFEGWMERLEKSSGFNGTTVVVSRGVKWRNLEGDNHYEEAGRDNHERRPGRHHHHGDTDPHAWQDLKNGEVYIVNIRDALIDLDPDGKEIYEANAVKYIKAIDEEDKAVKAAMAKLPPQHRRVITSHNAFGYFASAYGLEIIAPEGVSTESEASAQDVAKIIRQIRKEHIPAVFLENVTDRRLLDQIARETDAEVGGALYSDALSGPNGPAPTYLDMFRHNVRTLTSALSF